MLLVILSLALTALSASAVPVRELDASSFSTVVSDSETDTLVLFFDAPSADSRAASIAMMDSLAGRLKDTSTAAYTYDVKELGGYPAGLHVHSHGSEAELILFPAGGREPTRYSFAHDPLSQTDAGARAPRGGSGGAEDAGAEGAGAEDEHDEHDHEHDDHAHATRPSVIGALRWLKTASSFPASIPSLGLAELWEGREEDLFKAVASGADVIRARMAALKAENSALKARVHALEKGCAGAEL